MTTYYCIDMAATGAHIRQLRREQGLFVRDIRDSMGFEDGSSVYKWERGRSLPSVEHLLALSKLFDMHMEDILIWSHPPPDIPFLVSREMRRLCVDAISFGCSLVQHHLCPTKNG